MPCAYSHSTGQKCKRITWQHSQFCLLHMSRLASPTPTDDDRLKELEALIKADDGDWRGFSFPSELAFGNQTISFKVDASYASFGTLKLHKVRFLQEVYFANTNFSGGLTAEGTTFEKSADFSGCQFGGGITLLTVKFSKPATFHRAEFRDRAFFRAFFLERVNFNESIFHRSANFTGWRNIYARLRGISSMGMTATATISGGNPPTQRERFIRQFQALKVKLKYIFSYITSSLLKLCKSLQATANTIKKRYSRNNSDEELFDVFGDGADMESVEFINPSQVIFTNADLSKVYFRGTNLRGARFYAVNWYQPELHRNGLFDELFITNNPDGAFRHRNLPVLEETCRNLRAALEDGKNYAAAADFYVGEMEARRKGLSFVERHLFSVEALYRHASKYSSSVRRALTVLFLILILHCALSISIHSIEPWPSSALTERSIYNSLQLLLLQANPADHSNAQPLQQWLNLIFRLLAVIQIALVIFAFRARIKRN